MNKSLGSISLVLVAVISLSLAGCSSGPPDFTGRYVERGHATVLVVQEGESYVRYYPDGERILESGTYEIENSEIKFYKDGDTGQEPVICTLEGNELVNWVGGIKGVVFVREKSE